MKKGLFCLLVPLLMLICTIGDDDCCAQTRVVNIGTRNGTQYELPFNSFYRHSFNEMIYLQQEIGDEGYIGAIAFEKEGLQSIRFDSITIWMALVTESNIASTYSWVDATTMKQVFHQKNYIIPASDGTIMIPLDSAFYYDGVHNLAICIGKNSSEYSNAIKFEYHNTNIERCIYRQSDDDLSYSKHRGAVHGLSVFKRPNIKLIMNSEDEFCLAVASIQPTEITETSISIEWPMDVASSNYEVTILDTAISSNFDESSPIPVSDSTYTFADLQANTTYLIGVRKECDGNTYSEWKSVYVTTRQIPNYLPFYCDFETEESQSYWLLDNGTNNNKWIIGEATNPNEESMYSMYIGSPTSHSYNPSSMGVSYAKTLLRFEETGEFNIGYDWIGYGESRYDYMRAMLVPRDLIDNFTASSTLPNSVGPTTLPYGAMAVDGGEKLNLSQTWQRYMGIISITDTGDYYLVFLWRNDNSGGVNPPAGIDNIVIELAMCPGVEDVSVSNITTTSVTINANNNMGNSFMLYYREYGESAYDTLEISTPYIIDGLPMGTYFEAIIRSSCGADGVSYEATEFTFNTNCGDIILPWAFGAECSFMNRNNNHEEHPYCWECLNGNNQDYCWESDARDNVHWGRKALYFNGRNNLGEINDDWLFLPKMSFTGNEVISMWVKGKSSYTGDNNRSRFAIYYSTSDLTNITDTAHYEIIPFTGENIIDHYIDFNGTDWQHITLDLPTTLIGEHHLAFVISGKASNSFSIDDIYIYEKRGLEIPYNTRLTSISSTSASLEWNSIAHSFTIYYGAPGFNIDTAASVNSTTTMVDITDLNPNTTYEYRIVALHDHGEESIPSYPLTFTTMCIPISDEELPFTEGFEDNLAGENQSIDACWVKGTNNTTRYPYVNASKGHMTRNSLEFNGNYYSYSYVALPAFMTDVSELILSCSIYTNDYSDVTGSIEIGLMSNPYEISTFTPFDTLTPSQAGEWNDFKIPLTNFDSNEGSYITFKMANGDYNNAYLDDIKVELKGGCDMPTSPKVSHNNATSAVVAWDENSTTESWIVYYGKPGFDKDTVSNPIIASGIPIATIPGLTPQTQYEFCIVAECINGGLSAESMRIRFKTTCGAVSDLPYREGFESYAVGNDAEIDPCWTKKLIGNSNSAYPYPTSSAATVGNRGLYLSSHEEDDATYCSYVALPMFEDELNHLKIKFDIKSRIGQRTDYKYHSIMVVGVMGNPYDITTFDTLQIIDLSNRPSGTIQSHEIPLNTYMGENKYIAFLSPYIDKENKDYGENIIYLDNIEVNLLPLCQRPFNLIANVDQATINLNWEGNSESYEIKYSKNPNMMPSTTVTSNDNSMTLTGLENYTYYYINIRGICSEEQSQWMIYPIMVRTGMNCGEGYQNAMDTIGDGDNVSYEYVINGGGAISSGRNWLIFDADELSSSGIIGATNIIHSISLQTGKVGSAMPLRIYMKETNLEEFSANGDDTISLNQMTLVYDGVYQFKNNSWNEIMLDSPYQYVSSSNLMIAFERYDEIEFTSRFCYSPVNKYRTAYTYNNASGIHSEAKKFRGNVAFNICEDTSDCIRPYHIKKSNITANSIDLNWGGNSEEYQIVYDNKLFNPDYINTQQSIVTTENNITIQGLTEMTRYFIYLRSICDSDSSAWTNPIVVKTPCNIIDLPYSENFDSYTVGATAIEGQEIIPCWTKGSNFSPNIYPCLQSSTSASAPNSMIFHATTDNYSYVALPMFSAPIANTMMRFKLHKQMNIQGHMFIGVMTDPTDINTFIHIATANPIDINTWESFEISFREYNGEDGYITFMMPNRKNATLELDDIEVMEIPNCLTPINITVPHQTISTTAAIVQWNNEDDNATEYEVKYGISGFSIDEENIATTQTNSITLTDLNEGTEYDVYVRNKCSESNYSDWSERITFKTATRCLVPEIVNSEISSTTAIISWAGKASSYQLLIKEANTDLWSDTITTNEFQYMFENLLAKTSYNIQLRSICEQGSYSNWTEATFITKSGEDIEKNGYDFTFEIYPNPTENNTTIKVNGISGKVIIKIIDIQGNQLLSETITCGIDCEKQINVERLVHGTYFVQIIGNEVNGVRKLIVR